MGTPQPATDRESLAGLVERETFHNDAGDTPRPQPAQGDRPRRDRRQARPDLRHRLHRHRTKDKPVVFVTPGRSKEMVARFEAFLAQHGGTPSRIAEVVCDMSGAFLAAAGKTFDEAAVTVDWFHVVQMFTKAVDDVRRAEAKHGKLPKSLRWAILKRADRLTYVQADALAELETSSLLTAVAWHIKEMLRWIRKAEGNQAARRRITHFPRHAR